MNSYERDGIHIQTAEPLTDGELAAMIDFIKSTRPKPTPTEHPPACATPDTDGHHPCDLDCPVWRAAERERSRPTAGKWTCSTNEENWDCFEELDTEADAIEYGKVHAEEYGIEDGGTYWTGQIEPVEVDELARSATNAERAVECMEDHLYDNVGGEIDNEIKATPEQLSDLDERLARTVKQWLVHHDLAPHVFRIERVKSHTFHQCQERDTMKNDPDHHPRCIRHEGHPMDEEGHDFQDDRCNSPSCSGCRSRRP